jgi:hypothetical protein
MDYRRYIAETTVSSNEVLDDWRWLIGPDLELWCVTKAGDALLRSANDGSIHFLDVVAGKVERLADDEAAFEDAVASPTNADRWLVREVVEGQAALGMQPGTDECLSFKHPPALGGQLDPDNLETCNVPVHFSIAGQIHRQIKDLPPGTKIGKIKIVAPGASPASNSRPWWKFW